MLGFKSMNSSRVIPGGIEIVHMIYKGQAEFVREAQLVLAEQLERLAA
jgi:hypothetical protein